MHSKCNGLSFRGEIPWDQIKVGDRLTLVHEPENPYDSNALKIIHNRTNFHLGYVPKDSANLLLNEIKATLFRCEVAEVTGGYGYKTQKGINIKIEYDFEEK